MRVGALQIVPGTSRRRRRRLDRITLGFGVAAVASIATVAAGELAHVWRRGSAPLPAETDDVIAAAEEAARQSVEVAVEGYRATPARENALFNLFASFTGTFMFVRSSTYVIRRRGEVGPFRNVVVGNRHIHHFVPGIVLAFVSGAAGLVTRTADGERWLAIPFGIGAALTLDESALLLQLDDVYWSQEGIVSVQITLATIALLGALATARRAMRRGAESVLEAGDAQPAATVEAPAGGVSPAGRAQIT
jgi:hypothetical protein